jgi:hypothetical protein
LCMRVRKYTSKAELRERAHKVVGAFLEKRGRILQGFNQPRERAQVSDLAAKEEGGRKLHSSRHKERGNSKAS